jgi:diguanylate cyclase
MQLPTRTRRSARTGVIATVSSGLLLLAWPAGPAQAVGTYVVTGALHLGNGATIASAALFLALIGILTAVFLAGRQSVNWNRRAQKAPAPVDQNVVMEAAVIVGNEAGRIIALIDASVGSHTSYANQLRDLEDRIVSVTTADQLRTIAKLLASENHRMRRDAEGMATELEASQKQIDGLRQRLAQARDESLLDALTEVANRRAFDTVMEQSIATAAQTGTPLSVALTDIDAFKSINDKFGHLSGDDVLKHFAGILSEQARSTDTVARIGGEEFAIIMPGTESLAASVRAERLRSSIADQAFPIKGRAPITVTASFGVAQLRDGEDVDDFMRRADGRLYRAKSLGRIRVVTT